MFWAESRARLVRENVTEEAVGPFPMGRLGGENKQEQEECPGQSNPCCTSGRAARLRAQPIVVNQFEKTQAPTTLSLTYQVVSGTCL